MSSLATLQGQWAFIGPRCASGACNPCSGIVSSAQKSPALGLMLCSVLKFLIVFELGALCLCFALDLQIK